MNHDFMKINPVVVSVSLVVFGVVGWNNTQVIKEKNIIEKERMTQDVNKEQIVNCEQKVKEKVENFN